MPLTKEQKASIVKELSHIFGRVRLLIDGYEFVAETAMYKRSLVIQWFVNGQCKGAWLINDCEERRRFCPIKILRLYPKSKAALLKRKLGKKSALSIGVDETITAYGFCWRSPNTMLRHLIANNESIELAVIGNAHI